jgi:hypothetical protein
MQSQTTVTVKVRRTMHSTQTLDITVEYWYDNGEIGMNAYITKDQIDKVWPEYDNESVITLYAENRDVKPDEVDYIEDGNMSEIIDLLLRDRNCDDDIARLIRGDAHPSAAARSIKDVMDKQRRVQSQSESVISFTEFISEDVTGGYDDGAVLTFKNMRITKKQDAWLVETEDVRKAGAWVQVTGTAAGVIKDHVLSMAKQSQVKQPAPAKAPAKAAPATPAAPAAPATAPKA